MDRPAVSGRPALPLACSRSPVRRAGARGRRIGRVEETIEMTVCALHALEPRCHFDFWEAFILQIYLRIQTADTTSRRSDT